MLPHLVRPLLLVALVPTLHAQVGGFDATPTGAPGGRGRPRERGEVRFVVIGDYGTTQPESFAVAELARDLRPDFVVTVGDNNYPDGEATTIDANIGQHYHEFIGGYAGNYGAGALVQKFFPCLGNHDWHQTGALPYLDYFTLPGNERYYDFAKGPVHFFALDSDPAEPDGTKADSVQAAWLEARLAAASEPFKFVYLHHSPYNSSDNHGSQGDQQWPYKEWGASLVLSGHDHIYERASLSGLPYVVNGLGGNERYGFLAPIGGSALRYNASEGLLLVDADRETARLSFLTSGDVVMDDFVLPKGGIDPGVDALVTVGDLWKFRDSGLDPGPTWTTLAYDDSAWAAGHAELGYGDGDEATVVSYGGVASARHITTWFRRTFTVPSPSLYAALQFRLKYDDGAIVYVNGVEVARVNLPAGAVTSTTLASTSIAGDEETTFYPFTFPASLLVPGANQLAVEVHQQSQSSSDISFDFELVGLRAGTTLVARGANWRYLDTGVAPVASWNGLAFDDSAWSVGPAQLGYGEGDEATTVAYGSPLARHPTTWFRRSFSVADAAAVRWLELDLLRDDGAIVSINGVEAVRFNLPRGKVTPATYAAQNRTGSDENQFERTSLDPRLLVSGTNVIAVELHNASAANSDLSFDLGLIAH